MPAPSGFQLSGSAPELYQRYGVAAIGTAKAQELVTLAALQPGERVLDVACGTGVVARQAAQAVGTTGQVVGLDINDGMLQVARPVEPSVGAPVTWRCFYTTKCTCASAYHVFKADLRVRVPYLKEPLGRK